MQKRHFAATSGRGSGGVYPLARNPEPSEVQGPGKGRRKGTIVSIDCTRGQTLGGKKIDMSGEAQRDIEHYEAKTDIEHYEAKTETRTVNERCEDEDGGGSGRGVAAPQASAAGGARGRQRQALTRSVLMVGDAVPERG